MLDGSNVISAGKKNKSLRRDDAIGKRRSEYGHGEVNIVVLAACVQSNCWNAVCGLPGQTTHLVQTCERDWATNALR
jgi:hypothetical protein